MGSQPHVGRIWGLAAPKSHSFYIVSMVTFGRKEVGFGPPRYTRLNVEGFSGPFGPGGGGSYDPPPPSLRAWGRRPPETFGREEGVRTPRHICAGDRSLGN